MADITMCTNRVCSIRATCRRYLAHPSHWQSRFAANPKGGPDCSEHWLVDVNAEARAGRPANVRTLFEVDAEIDANRALGVL